MLLVCIATAVAVPLALSQRVAKIETEAYCEDGAACVTLTWKAVRKAVGYTVEYSYDGENTVAATTVNTHYEIPKKKNNTLKYRVKPNFSDKEGEYSESKKIEVAAMTLSKTDENSVTLNSNGILGWGKTAFASPSGTEYAYAYQVRYSANGLQYTEINATVNYCDLTSYIVYAVDYNEGEPWTDVTLNVKIKALNCGLSGLDNSLKTDGRYSFLYNAYEENEFTEKEILITKERYQSIAR